VSAKKVDFDRLAAALRDYPFAYLVTVDDGYRVHTVTVEPELREQILDVGPIGSKTLTNIESRTGVTLLWPPSTPGGYSLIVDGDGEVSESAQLHVVPTRALLHRNAAPDARGDLHDCVVFSTP
jgi:hypothetical protein